MKTLILIIACCSATLCQAQTFTLKSKELGGQAAIRQVFNASGCNGENISPQLYWENPPSGTRSFAVTIHDENAPTGSGWWHWVIFDIDRSVSELRSGAGTVEKQLAPPNSIQSRTDFGVPGYGGPCPPPGSGIHKYTITIYALDIAKLGLDQNAAAALVGFNLSAHVIEKASLVFYFRR
ncbi:YbhB/YbcL family Raf kinase inhibitor-like protein [Sediminibacterium ginsengisoli]|uniref:Phospholipid-binding protein, PBP family n=1 Tax=Sediminibacterium ginsengisoli TaxID=413434 RepID=A0A1T4LAI7_9BACT|nr:YbhB/YbcL family Raf kinase inhibitor-like protein [Sediminibacterium ginsengisoli]SJZ51792.1 hypothetical protein SAMN04488132_102401 [Sediminibacterium ginsengisoli]